VALVTFWKRRAVEAETQSPETKSVAPRHPTPTPGGSGRQVLVVEDDDSLRDLVVRNLTARGHQVRQTADAASALEVLRQETPEVLVLDINLPDATGWDILRAAQLSAETAVVMLTAVPVSPSRLQEFRPVAYLPKPFPLEALMRLVERSGQRAEEQDDAANA
jgi:DNA-binding response OmpR family regulator